MLTVSDYTLYELINYCAWFYQVHWLEALTRWRDDDYGKHRAAVQARRLLWSILFRDYAQPVDSIAIAFRVEERTVRDAIHRTVAGDLEKARQDLDLERRLRHECVERAQFSGVDRKARRARPGDARVDDAGGAGCLAEPVLVGSVGDQLSDASRAAAHGERE